MKDQEHRLQVSCVKWFRLQYQQYSKLLWAIPNGGHRNVITAQRLKDEGVTAGVPDLFLAMPKDVWTGPNQSTLLFCGLFIELKIRPNKPTKEQQKMMQRLIGQKYKCVVVHTLDEFMIQIQTYIG